MKIYKLMPVLVVMCCLIINPAYADKYNNKSALFHLDKGDHFHDLGKIEEATREYLESLKFTTDKNENIRAFGSLTAVYLEKYELDNAYIYCQKLMQIDPGNSWGQNKMNIIQDIKMVYEQPTIVASELSVESNYNRGMSALGENDAEAAKWFRKAADQGHAEAQSSLGGLYCNGAGVSRNYTEGAKWFRKAADQGNAQAQYSLGCLYYQGYGVSFSYTEAAKWFRKAADQGHAEAQYQLADMYHAGAGLSQSYAEAAKWYRKAADQGHLSAQDQLADFYYYGKEGVSQSYAEAAKWYRKAADQGNLGAQYQLATMYYNGQGVAQSYTEAAKWYRKPADKGNLGAQYQLATMYYNGQGVDQNYMEANMLYKKAADQGHAEAQFSLAIMLRNGQGVVAQSNTEAAKWFRKAADQGHAKAQNILGYLYQEGEQGSRNYTVAFGWFKKAADQGYADAQNNLGYYYEYGQGVSQSYTEAAKWYKKAADQGHAKAQKNLAMLRRERERVPAPREDSYSIDEILVGLGKIMIIGGAIFSEPSNTPSNNYPSEKTKNGYSECRDNVINSKRLVHCYVTSRLLDNNTNDANCDDPKTAFRSNDSLYCEKALDGEGVGTYWCDPKTKFYHEEAEVVIDSICR